LAARSRGESAGKTFATDFRMATWSCSSRFANSRRLEISALADVGSPMAAKAMLRHANLATTTAHYIKFVHAAAIREMDKISSLFDNESSFGHPN